MARISFTAIVSEIVGKLAGSVFQYSYGGWQIHTRVSPGNPQSNYQQLRRGWYGFIRAAWRNLTNTQRQTFIDNAPTPGQGFNFFTACNINLILINEPMIDLFIPSVDPESFAMIFTEYTPGNPTTLCPPKCGHIKAKKPSPDTTVPTGHKLLVYLTESYPESRTFVSPSAPSPIKVFDEGTDLATAYDFIDDYYARFGVPGDNTALTMKTVLIRKSNGLRGAESFNNTTEDLMPNKYIPIAAFSSEQQITGGTTDTIGTLTLPANTITADNQRCVVQYVGSVSITGGAFAPDINILGFTESLSNFPASRHIQIRIDVIRQDSTHAAFNIWLQTGDQLDLLDSAPNQVVDWTVDNDFSITASPPALSALNIYFGTLDFIAEP